MNNTNYFPKMTELCQSFPTLDKADGVAPFDPQKLDDWAFSGAPSHGGLHAARFVLSVFSGRGGCVRAYPRRKGSEHPWRFRVETYWRCGPFDLADACSTWDAEHRRACAAWIAEA